MCGVGVVDMGVPLFVALHNGGAGPRADTSGLMGLNLCARGLRLVGCVFICRIGCRV